MKKIYPIRALVLLFCIASMQMGAALSGVYTINSGLGTSGTNFQTFSAFATAINSQGVSGPVTVNVTGGPFNEQVTFTAFTGASAVNNVVINGNGCTLTWQGSSTQPWTMGLNGTDYLTVNNLMMYGTDATYAMVGHLWNGADYNSFIGCRFETNANQTGTYQCPFSISGSSNVPSTTGAVSGNYNAVRSCTLQNGYYSYCSTGLTSGAFTHHNSLIDSKITDFYLYGPYVYYNKYFTMKNCVIDRITRTTSTTTYASYFLYNNYATVDGNKWYKLFEAQQGSTSAIYWYMYYQHTPGDGRQSFRNNIITDIKNNGTIYMYMLYGGWDIYHNTLDWDYPAGNHTGTLYSLYAYSGSTYSENRIFNNIVTMRKPGSGTRYGMYFGGVTGGVTVDYNDVVVGTGSGGNYVGYYTTTATNLAGWQSQGMDLHGWSVDPQYTSTSDLHPTNTSINNSGTPLAVILDQQKAPRSGTTPDIGALEFLSVNCSGTPNPGAVVSPTYQLCPGESADLILSNFSSDLGITYTWQSSTQSSVGIWSAPIPNETTPLLTTPPTYTNTWYQAIVTCTNSSQSVSSVGYIQVAGTTTSTAPYYESFENIPSNNKLPNCSWSASDLGGTTITYTAANTLNRVPRTGSKFASFFYNPGGVKSFYTNGIWLDAGITYSASVWYTTEYYGYNNWTDLSILVSTIQGATGAQTVATSNGPAISNIYKSISNTFTVANSGLYYVGVQATGNSNSSAQYLTWDDLRIEIPCQVNSPSLAVTSNQSTICVNQSAILQASGADSYTWSTGAQSDNISVTPFYAGMSSYTVTGTNSLTGCSSSMVQQLVVNPAPQVSAFAHPPVVCEGSAANLYATGAANYIWSNNSTGNVVTINPTTIGVNTFVVVGTNQFNCQGSAVAQVVVNGKPNISATFPQVICVGEPAVIAITGGQSYQVLSGNSLNTTNPATVMPSASTQYTINGTDANGCQNFTVVAIAVDICEGISESSSLFGLRVYPNPTNANLNIELNTTAQKNVEVVDVTGRVVFAGSTSSNLLQVDLSQVANGVYYVKVKSNEDVQVIKVIRN